MAGWNDFFVAVAGASATLTGLIFVGVSISLTKILSVPGLPGRALLSLVLLLNVLLLSLLFLVPALPVKTTGGLVLGMSSFAWLVVFRLDLQNIQREQKQLRRQYLFNMVIDQIATVCFVVMGIGLMAGWTNSLFWSVPAIFVSVIKGVIDGWVLLVEINR